MLPVLLMIMTGIIGVSFAIFNRQSLNQGTDAAARLLANEGSTKSSNGDSSLTDPCQAAFTEITNLTTGLDPNQITVTYTFNGTAIGPYMGPTLNTCAGDESYLGSGNLTVTTSYPCNVMGVGVNKIFAGCQLGATKTERSY
jgi:Flp pilus assembly protein TadG